MQTLLLSCVLPVFASLCLVPTSSRAQVPQLVNYQGRIAVGTTNFNGSGAFKFALVNAAGTTTYWSNDGTSSAGSQPTSAVTLTVTMGLYSVLLGDTSLANMTAIPNFVFANSDVRLRVWFNDGTNGSQLLTPDQRIAAVGYAMIAGGVNLPATTSATTGVITQGGAPLIHSFGSNNFFAGANVGNFTMTGGTNTVSGTSALSSNTSGSRNTAVGYQALMSNTSAFENTAIGYQALVSNTSGLFNTACGYQALQFNTTGGSNTACGWSALLQNTTGASNTASGRSALQNNTTAGQNVAIGSNALFAQSFSNAGTPWPTNNVAVGFQALQNNQPTFANNGIQNTALGTLALTSNTTGSANIALGYQAGFNLTTGNANIDIGNPGLLEKEASSESAALRSQPSSPAFGAPPRT